MGGAGPEPRDFLIAELTRGQRMARPDLGWARAEPRRHRDALALQNSTAQEINLHLAVRVGNLCVTRVLRW